MTSWLKSPDHARFVARCLKCFYTALLSSNESGILMTAMPRAELSVGDVNRHFDGGARISTSWRGVIMPAIELSSALKLHTAHMQTSASAKGDRGDGNEMKGLTVLNALVALNCADFITAFIPRILHQKSSFCGLGI